MPAKKLKVHFIGIGGIGVSALAKYYLENGYKVSGSDLVLSEITEVLKKRGAKIFTGPHRVEHLMPGIKQVIYSPAVNPANPELAEAKKRKLKIQSYPQALGELTKKYFTIAVSGTHGKSTTAAMLSLLLVKAGLDPTAIIGTKVREFGKGREEAASNCRVGKGKYLIIEADEWQASFLNYWPKIIVLTNIEREHLDFYKNLNNILNAYKKYIGHLPKDGVLVVNKNDKNSYSTFSTAVENVRYYSSGQKEVKKLRKILKVPGEHNVYNALAALTVARILKIPDKISFKALSEYRGSWRRFELSHAELRGTKRGTTRRITIVSDYAHHPTEIKVTLEAARKKFLRKKIWCVFQPHQYQRTFYLFKDFVKVFKEALGQRQGKPLIDRLIITDIYDVAGREEKRIKKKISSEKLVETINKGGVYLPKGEIVRYLKENLNGSEAIIIMGAGDIYKLCEQF